MAVKTRTPAEIKLPSAHDWRTTDTDEINKRRWRAQQETFGISNLEPRHPVFSNFRVRSASGLTYTVEVRDVGQRQFACDCVDFRINGLGTCKHVEAVLLQLQARYRRLFEKASRDGSTRLEVVVDGANDTLRLLNGNGKLPRELRPWFHGKRLLSNGSPEEAVAAFEQLRIRGCPELRVSQEVAPWLESRRRVEERKRLRHEYELKVQSGEWPAQETLVPLFPYQREGMLHLAFSERALLADEMGLGKTIQAIAACALLHRLGQAHRVLVVTPASLKSEWEEQIRKFTGLAHQLVFGGPPQRLRAYAAAAADNAQEPGSVPFFTIVNYEQMVADALEVNQRLQPDIVVLDEAQRIKNWNTKTAQAIKRLKSRYAFVLTGTPIENRIDELHSLMDYLNPAALGPLFRFNRDFYELDERGRPAGYRNLDQLHARIRPYLLRRRKVDVETELPERTDHKRFVKLSETQQENYDYHEQQANRLLSALKRRPLSKQEQEKLQRELAMMRMVCDSNYILDPEDRTCPKLAEVEKLLEECRENDAKVIIFSEWERMLELVREICQRGGFGYAWHTGSVPQKRRRAEINAFKIDPECRVFLSTDSGATGLNLQNASVVVNCDLPWNPAKLEQRIARAWRKHQTKPVTVFNLISEDTIEHRMLDTLATKQSVAASVLDQGGKVKEIKLRSGRQAFIERLQQLVGSAKPVTPQPLPAPDRKLSPDPAIAFAQLAREKIDGALIHCEERYPQDGAHSVLLVVVDRDASSVRERLSGLHAELFGPGKSDPLAPTQLEVIDHATHEALERLIAAGLISRTTRSSRPLLPDTESASPPPLSAEERAKAKTYRDAANHALSLARVLGPAGFATETRNHLLEAALAMGRALAVENRLPAPGSLAEALLPPLSHSWKGTLSLLRAYVADPNQPWQEPLQELQKV